MKRLLSLGWRLLFVLVLTLIVGHLYLRSGFPYTHDGENHLARFANYKIALKEGQLPPRWAPNLMNRYGYPVFNYNYPLANILSVPFSLLKIEYEATFKILALVAIATGITGVLSWVKQLKYSSSVQVLAALLYVTSPYLINVIYYRGNIGELWALALLPWLLWLTHIKLRPWWFLLISSGLWSAWFLSHNLAAIFGTPLILIYTAVQLRSRSEMIEFLKPLGLGFLLSLWFWLPALAEKNAVVLGGGELATSFNQHFVTLNQLIFDNFRFGFSQAGPVDGLNFSLGIAQLLVLILVWLFFISRRFKSTSTLVTSLLVTSVLVVLQLAITEPIWQVVPFVRYLQFPWRLSLFIVVMQIPIATWLFSQIGTWGRRVFLLMLLGQLLVVSRLSAVDYFHRTTVDYDAFSQSTSTQNENLAAGFTYTEIADWQPGPAIVDGDGSIQVQYWKGSDRQYQLSLSQESVVVEPTMAFPGWQTTINQERLVEYVDSEDIQGRLAYTLPAGEYQVRTRFTQWTWARLLGNTVSLFALTSLGIWSLWQIKRRNA